ncbi:MAG TPA: hypothetical protein VIE43_13810 [Thermoanaerobaculia bacterium]|jgi:hypothetical protein|nr:hypothetical protein [Thermoanaerobaculia bacterium]
MKTLLRTSVLAAALALTVLATSGHAVANGTCYVSCYNPTTNKFTLMTIRTTRAVCCGDFNLCPAGSSPGSPQAYMPPTGGPIVTCPV